MACVPPAIENEVNYRDGYRCAYCGRSGFDVWTSMGIDHFKPKSRGGSDGTSNLHACCSACNNYMQAKEFATMEEARQHCRKCMTQDWIAYQVLIAKWLADQMPRPAE